MFNTLTASIESNLAHVSDVDPVTGRDAPALDFDDANVVSQVGVSEIEHDIGGTDFLNLHLVPLYEPILPNSLGHPMERECIHVVGVSIGIEV